ncbi:lactococcin 972 family bacteriocin [Nocardiopsis sp. EMB25]|uniref:lactococcin 972 family bacteriocin n=1 Tax=Nocardiopsis TaxID=2013 RepID=UPI000A047B05|nr:MULTISPECIES: lactococcin 972 family bacteriocin [Nocardiopsis]MCY9787584.1 lactococcin 972 family bacteriocin [Nocardiopsis sp. EMB25]
MKINFRRTTVTVLLTSGLALGAAGIAAADVDYVGGGTWYHGITETRVYSNYYHGSVCHGSTAVGTTVVRDSAPAGGTSRASAPRAWTNNQSYYRTSC